MTLQNNSCSISIDANGNTIINTESIDPANAAKIAKSVDLTFNTTNINYYVAGHETCSSNSLGGVTEHLYNGFSRRTKTTNYANGRELRSVVAYHDDGSMATVGEITTSGTNTTSYSTQQTVEGKPGAYEITVTDPQGNQTVNYYSGNGQLYRSEGATYPTETAFDAAGRMVQLHTWRDATGNPDITRWYYDLFTGAVTNKLYADGKGTAYTYLNDGRVASRNWARNIITTYGYADTATGSIRTTDYNDTTPSVTNYYNLIGQLVKVEDGTGTTTFGYDLRGRLITETNAFAVITRSYDTYGRYAEFILNPVNPVYPAQKIVFGYDTLNRLNSITSIVGTEINTFTYSYLLGTQIISGYTVTNPEAGTTNLIVTRTYEPNRDLISAVTNSFVVPVPSVVSSFNYSNGSTGKRTSRIDYYNGSSVTNTFDYNIRDELTNAVMNASEQCLVYDDIGNRQTSTVNSISSVYTANNINQYTSVNAGGATRSISYDDDGNLTFNGSEWHHTYDGENRLLKSEPHSATNGSVMFEYRYNYKNLRVGKTKKQLSGRSPSYPFDPSGEGTWDTVETRNYIWDGWNIAAEIIIDQTLFTTNISYYTWGLDLSGTLQGAGGVGGLLCDTKVTNLGTNTHFAVGDANGNITEYVDVSGTIVAHGEHNSFGETELSGSMKDGFTHWFSSKPLDAKTGLVQYELRLYLPDLGIFTSADPIAEQNNPSDILIINLHLFVDNDAVNYWDVHGMQKESKPNPLTVPPYSTATVKYQVLGRIHEGHFPHCKSEGNMDMINYEKHYDVLMKTYGMRTQSIRKLIGNNIYFFATSSNDPTQLYGMDIDGPISIKKIKAEVFVWQLKLTITNVKTCGCCKKGKTCGPEKKVPQAKETHVLEYKEILQ
ncbi:MAG: RHS repeat-associated core domain-containing protein [Kiritimatiellia bacterium]